ncbi:MAG: DUF3617 family protein [Burkholderiales bacterium]
MASIWVTLAALALAAGTAHGATLDDLLARQREGLWELRPPAGNPMRFCMTGKAQRDARAQMQSVLQGMGCRYVTDRAQGERFEVVARCASPNPEFGTFEVNASGTAKPEQVQFAARVSGGGPAVQKFAANSAWKGTVQWRRVGACAPGAAPGLQPPA